MSFRTGRCRLLLRHQRKEPIPLSSNTERLHDPGERPRDTSDAHRRGKGEWAVVARGHLLVKVTIRAAKSPHSDGNSVPPAESSLRPKASLPCTKGKSMSPIYPARSTRRCLRGRHAEPPGVRGHWERGSASIPPRGSRRDLGSPVLSQVGEAALSPRGACGLRGLPGELMPRQRMT